MIEVRHAGTADLEPALDVWRAANEARGRAPSPARIERVRAKLRARDAGVVVARDRPPAVAMGVGEPRPADHGAG
ncbi:hypothetical protein AB0M46_49025, partial [Dactylosporangium sp. NPDC051485]|uniref:hypothetical protein n=1 Tax=Dactylosporangium sp. NPDC051485 TaxID=3154846 RepID=UPI0034485EEF